MRPEQQSVDGQSWVCDVWGVAHEDPRDAINVAPIDDSPRTRHESTSHEHADSHNEDISLLTPESVAANTLLEGCEHVRGVVCSDTGQPPDTLNVATPRTHQQEPTPQPVSGSGSPFSPSDIQHGDHPQHVVIEFLLGEQTFQASGILSANNRSASRSLRTICLGVCLVCFISILPTPFLRDYLTNRRWTYFKGS